MAASPTREWQFDGLVGPTHNYAGLAMGNLAAAKHAGAVSNPRLAALQGLEKMRFVRDLGMPQAILPPHYRPMIQYLKRAGFSGHLGQMLKEAANLTPGLLASIYSSSFMWAANAATVTPSRDTGGLLHFSPANLVSHFHRAIETECTQLVLSKIFHNSALFKVNYGQYPIRMMSDEGAANHMRVINNHSDNATHIFVYGQSFEKTLEKIRFIPRQQRVSSESIARLHGLNKDQCMYLQQSPNVIDQGVFHHDVIGMSSAGRMIVHAESFIPEHQQQLRDAMAKQGVLYEEVSTESLAVKDAVSTYLFNSQLLEREDGSAVLVAPGECATHAGVARLIAEWKDRNILDKVHFIDVRESMRNGGGPACLRLRVEMTPEESAAMHQGIVLTDARYAALKEWIQHHYRDRLSFDDLRDPLFVRELDAAYAALEPIIGMPGLYDPYRID